MAKKLNTTVHVLDDEGATHVFGPGDDVPTWAAKKITNPHVWEGGDEDEAAAPAPRSGRGRRGEAKE